ncbi:MAG TPA: HAD-IA family hydrolase [Gemmataceae bacterium]|nr:HAD-IA family hydrolase [Gemmataceae bacterium]
MSYRLVVWDFDGTLADSLAVTVDLFNRLAPEMGFRPIADPVAARALPTRQFLKLHGISLWRLPKIVRRFQAAAADHADKLQLFPGLPPVLRELRSRGARLGVLSSNKEDNIRRCLRANGVEDAFAFVVGYPKLFGKGKALRRIMKAERISPGEVLYVGDEVRDVEASKKARVTVAAVTWGFHAESLLRDNGADHVVTEPRELLELVTPALAAG